MNHSPLERSVLHLSLIEGVGPVTSTRLIKQLSDDQLANVYAMSAFEIAQCSGISSVQAHKIAAGLADKALLEREYTLCQQYAISCTTVMSDTYPDSLKHIYAPPAVIYWQGTLPQNDKGVALVGSRQPNAYGQRVIDALVPSLVKAGCSIVSGGALGIDTMAHRVAVQLGGHTTVVLGSGLLNLYPLANKRLFETIVQQGGSLVSIFPLGTRALPGNFPARNRIIAGLSQGTIVVQAADKSGALITARYALEQGREVMAVPGAIDDPLSQGCHELIMQGATLIANAQSMLSCLGLKSEMTKQSSAAVYKERMSSSLPASLSLEDQILVYCAQPRSTDELVMHSALQADSVTALLFELQLAGLLEQDFSGKWQAKNS